MGLKQIILSSILPLTLASTAISQVVPQTAVDSERKTRVVTRAAPDTNRLGTNVDNSICYEINDWSDNGNRVPCAVGDKGMQEARNMGLGWVRFWLYMNQTNPAPGVYDWTMPDKEIASARKAGLNVLIAVNSIPKWAMVHNPNVFKCDGTGVREPDQQALEAYVRAAVTRYKDVAKLWSFGNEMGNPEAWDQECNANGLASYNDYVRLYNTLWSPAYKIVKEITKNVPVGGPEEGADYSTRDALHVEADKGRVFDLILIHNYDDSDNYPAAALHNLDVGFGPVFKMYRDNRLVSVTETGPMVPDSWNEEQMNAAASQIYGYLKGAFELGIDKVYNYRLISSCRSTAGWAAPLLKSCNIVRQDAYEWTPVGTAMHDFATSHP